MVSVGVLAMLVNVGVLVIVTIADRAIELIVRNFAKSRLHRTKCAPVVHDSDTWLPNIPRSIVKYHRHPAILTTVLCTVFLIASELVTELGVDVSETCNPAEKSGTVIRPGDSSPNRTPVELGASAFFMQTIVFVDGSLTRVTAGMPKRITGKECLSCLIKDNNPDIARGCAVRLKSTFPPGTLNVGVKKTDNAFGTVGVGFRTRVGIMKTFRGNGDLTSNGKRMAVFLFAYDPQDDEREELLYFEYGFQAHISALKDQAAKTPGEEVWETATSQVNVWSIRCDENALSRLNFEETMMIYRTIQLENPIKPAVFQDTKERFEPISDEDVYRAILSLKVIDDDNSTGTYYEYTLCAYYRLEFLLPIIACLLILLCLGFFSSMLSSAFKKEEMPYNSRSWYKHCQRFVGGRKNDEAAGLSKRKSGYFDTIYEEMVLVDEENNGSQRILLRSRSSRRPEVEMSADHVECAGERFERMESQA